MIKILITFIPESCDHTKISIFMSFAYFELNNQGKLVSRCSAYAFLASYFWNSPFRSVLALQSQEILP